jgi:hypothetical protein
MARFLLILAVPLVLAGCAPRNVPPDQAQVTLSNTRVERKNGEDVFSVDYKFTRGRPDRGRMYRLNLVSGSDQSYWVDAYWNEKQLTGTIEAEMSFRDARFEPSKYFEAQLVVYMGPTNTEPVPISNKITFGTPTAEDIVGGDGEPDPQPPPSEQPQIAQAPPSAVPNIPMTPPVGIGPRFPRSGVLPTGVPLGRLEPSKGAGTTSTTPLTSPPTSSTVSSVTGLDTPLAGGKGGVPFRTGDASGRIVLGFRYAVGSWAGQPALRTLEPLYDRAATARDGEVIAREGYAVGGVNVATGAFVEGVQIIFMRVKPDGTLDPADTYTSDWLGEQSREAATALDGGGALVLGIHGRRAAVVDAVGLVLKP